MIWCGYRMEQNSEKAKAEENASRFYGAVKSYNNFDKLEILGVIQSLLSPTHEEECFIGTYYRVRGNVETLLGITHAKHFQAVSMLARGMFELAVDIKMLEATPNGWLKMMVFHDVEKLRCAQKIIAFKETHPDADVDVTIYETFILENKTRIDLLRKTAWSQITVTDKLHWSGIRMAERISQLGPPMDILYEVEYPRLSWYVHSGLTGVWNLKSETFIYLCSRAFSIAADCYRQVLDVMIRKFKIDKGIKNIDAKLYAAKVLAFNDDPQIEDWLMKSIQD